MGNGIILNEVWQTIKGFEGLYEISNMGRVRSIDRIVKTTKGERIYKGKNINLQTSGNGHQMVRLSKNSTTFPNKIHKLVAKHFLPNPKCLKYIDHIDNNKLNNFVSNLKWITNRENVSKGVLSKNKPKSSKYTGVSWHKHHKLWIASIQIKGENKYLGMYPNELEAHNAYKIALNTYGENTDNYAF